MLSPAQSPRRKALGELSPNRATPKSERGAGKLFSKLLRTSEPVTVYDETKENKGDLLNLSQDSSVKVEKTPPAKSASTLNPTESKLLGSSRSPFPIHVSMNRRTPVKNGSKSLTPKSLTPKTASKLHKSQVCKRLSSSQYEISFPRGSMGLELEPVIVSSEKALGVKVKDFYYGLDYQGLDPAVLEDCIQIGDVISTVNDTNVLSMSFHDILQVIKSTKDSHVRKVVFKNISVSWEATHPHNSNKGSPVEYDGSHGSKDNSFSNALTPQKPLSTMNGGSSSSGGNTESPAVWKVYPGSTNNSPSNGGRVNTPLKAFSNTELIPSLTISPKAVRALSMSGATTSPLEANKEKEERERSKSSSSKGGKVSPLTRPITTTDLTVVLKEMGASLATGASKVGRKILQPFTGSSEVDILVSRKHELLCELSQSCMLLGAAQEKENDLTSQLDHAKQQEIDAKKALFLSEECKGDLQSTIFMLETEIMTLKSENNDLLLRTQHHSQDWSLQQEETREYVVRIEGLENEVNDWKAVNEENKLAFASQQQELVDNKATIHEMSLQLDSEREHAITASSEFEATIEKMSQESMALKGEMEVAVKEATAQLVAAEKLRDELVAENEYLKERTHTDKNGLQLELNNMKTSLQSLQQLHTDEIVKREEEMHNCSNDWKTERECLEKERDSHKNESLSLQSQLVTRDEEIEVLKTEMLSLSSFQRDAVTNLEIYERQKVCSRLGNAVLAHHNDSVDQKMRVLKESYDEERRQFADMNLEKMSKIDSLRNDLQESMKENEALVVECEVLRSRADSISKAAKETNEVQESSYRHALIESEQVQVTLRTDLEEMVLKVTVAEETIMDQLAEKEKLLLCISEKEANINEWACKYEEKEREKDKMEIMSNSTFDKYTTSLQQVTTQIRVLEQQSDVQRKEFEDRLLEKDSFIKDHIATNQTLQSQLNESLLQKACLEQEVNAEVEKCKVEKEKVNVLEAEIFAKHQNITSNSHTLERLQNENFKLKFDLEAAQMAYETLQITYDTAVVQHNEVSANLDKHRNLHQEVLCKHELSIREAENTMKELQQAKDLLLLQLKTSESARVQLNQSTVTSIKSIRNESKQAKNDVADMQIYLQSIVTQLTSKVHEISNNFQLLKDKYDHLQCSYDVLLKNSNDNVIDLETQLRDLTEAMTSKDVHNEEKLQLSFNKHNEVESLLKKAYVEHSQQEEKIVTLIDEIEDLKRQQSALQTKLDTNEVESVSLHKENKRLNTYSEEQKFAVVHLRTEFSRLNNEIPVLNETIERLEHELVESQQNWEKQRGVLLSQHVESETRWNSDNEKASKRVEELSKKLQKKEEALIKMNSKHESVLIELRKDTEKQLREKERDMEKEKKAFQRKADSCKETHEKTLISNKELQKQCVEVNSKVKVLEGEIASMKKELGRSNKKVASNEIVVKEKEEENVTLRQLVEKNTLLVETAMSKYQCEAEEADEESKKREAALMAQRDELMKSLQTQHDLLTATIADRDSELKEATLEHTSAITAMGVLKAEREELKIQFGALQVEMANLQAEYSRLEVTLGGNSTSAGSAGSAGNTGNGDDIPHAVLEVKELLQESIVENRALHTQRKDLTDALQLQQDAIDAAQHRESEFTLVKDGLERQLVQVQNRVEGLVCNHQATVTNLNDKLTDITRALAEANSQTYSLKQSLLEKQTELSALQQQVGKSLLTTITSDGNGDGDGGMMGAGYDEDKENMPFHSITTNQPTATSLSNRAILGEIDTRVRTTTTTTTTVALSSDSDLAVSDISSNSDEMNNNREGVDGGRPTHMMMEMDQCSKWQDCLVQRCLDLHECLTFAIAEHATASNDVSTSNHDNTTGEKETREGSESLIRASMALQEVHEQALLAPWVDSYSLPVQSLPPAHIMITQLGLPPMTTTSTTRTNASADKEKEKEIRQLQRDLSDAQVSLQALTTQLKAKHLSQSVRKNGEQVTLNGIVVKNLPPLSVPGSAQENENTIISPNTPAERVYMHMEELMELLEDGPLCMALQNSLNGPTTDGNNSTSSGDAGSVNVSVDGDSSLVLGGEVSTWQSFYTLLQHICAQYHTKVIAQATSMENSPRGEGSPSLVVLPEGHREDAYHGSTDDVIHGIGIGVEERGGLMVFSKGIDEVSMDTSLEMQPLQATLQRENSNNDLKVVAPIARWSSRTANNASYGGSCSHGGDSAFSPPAGKGHTYLPSTTFQPLMSANSDHSNGNGTSTSNGNGDATNSNGNDGDDDNVLVRSITSIHSQNSGFAHGFTSSLAQMIRDNDDCDEDLNGSGLHDDSGFWNISAQSIDGGSIASNSIDGDSIGEVSDSNASFDFASP